MTRSRSLAALVLLGLCWAVTVPLNKVAVSSGHHPIGLIFWQLAICAAFTGLYLGLRGRLPRLGTALAGHCLVIALLGSILPFSFIYRAISQLPAGIVAIVIATVPMFALVISLSIRIEAFSPVRLAGVLLGAIAVVILVGPDASLPDPDKAVFVLVAVLAYFCYGLEGNYVAWRAFRGYGPIQVICGASTVGALITGPVAWFSGAWVDLPGSWDNPERALVLAALIHAFIYAGYLWLVGATSPVFASQIAYVVTLGGVFFSALLLDERYSYWAFLALGLMMAGLFLVHPRQQRPGKPPYPAD